MSRVLIFRNTFVADDGDALDSEWSFDNCPTSNPLEVRSNGVDGTAGGGDQGAAINQSDTTDDNGDTPKATFADDQYATVESSQNTELASPGALCRCDPDSGDDYIADPGFHAGGLSLGYHSSGAYNFLASGGGTAGSPPYDVTLEVEGTTLRGYIGSSLEVSTTDSNHATGTPGIYCLVDSDVKVGDDLRAGNLFSRHPVSVQRGRYVHRVAEARREAWKAHPRLRMGT